MAGFSKEERLKTNLFKEGYKLGYHAALKDIIQFIHNNINNCSVELIDNLTAITNQLIKDKKL